MCKKKISARKRKTANFFSSNAKIAFINLIPVLIFGFFDCNNHISIRIDISNCVINIIFDQLTLHDS